MRSAHELFRARRWQEAEAAFRKALMSDPDDAMARAHLAACLINQRKHRESLREAENALKSGPDMAYPHYVRSVAARNLKKRKEARASAREAARLEPHNVTYLLALAEDHVREHEYAPALTLIDEALRIEPNEVDALNLKAEVLRRTGRVQEAEALSRESLAVDSENPNSFESRGFTLLRQGDREAAFSAFVEALRINPNSDSARQGALSVLRSKFWIYRLLLGYAIFLQRLPRKYAVLCTFIVLTLGRLWSDPSMRQGVAGYVLFPLCLFCLLICLSIFFATGLTNGVLVLTRKGRLLLTREERTASWIVDGAALCTAIIGVISWRTRDPLWGLALVLGGAVVGCGAIAQSAMFRNSRRALTLTLSLVGASTAIIVAFGFFVRSAMPGWVASQSVSVSSLHPQHVRVHRLRSGRPDKQMKSSRMPATPKPRAGAQAGRP